MDPPFTGMIRNSRSHLDQTLDQPVDGPLLFFNPEIEMSDQVQKVLGQNLHLQPGVVSFKPWQLVLYQF